MYQKYISESKICTSKYSSSLNILNNKSMWHIYVFDICIHLKKKKNWLKFKHRAKNPRRNTKPGRTYFCTHWNCTNIESNEISVMTTK